MPEDADLSTHAKIAVLQIVTLLQARYGLAAIDTDDIYRIAGYIDEAMVDAGNLRRIKDSVRAHDDERE